MKKTALIVSALVIIFSLLYFGRKSPPIGENHSAQPSDVEKPKLKPAMTTQTAKLSPPREDSKQVDPNHKADKKTEPAREAGSLSPADLQRLSRETFGDISNVNVPRYEDYGDDDKILYLYIMSLGTGSDFLQNLKTYTAPLKTVKKSEEIKRFWSELVGDWKGDFISEKVKDQDAAAYFTLSITESGFRVTLRDANQIYLMTESTNYTEDVTTGTNQQLPKNLVITLKAKPELGYKHNIYLQLFPSQSNDGIVGGMYNTDQWIDAENYILSDKIYFQRVSGP